MSSVSKKRAPEIVRVRKGQRDTDDPVKQAVAQLASEGQLGPADLYGRLMRVIERIAAWRELESAAPKRSDARDRLDKVARAANLLARELSDPAMVALLANAKNGLMGMQLDGDTKLTDAIVDLGERARMAMATVRQSGGRDAVSSARPGVRTDSISARELCAILTVEAWMLVRGDSPGRNNEEAARVADWLWQAAGGSSAGAAGGISWSRELRIARDSPVLPWMVSPAKPKATKEAVKVDALAKLRSEIRIVLHTP